MGLRKHHLDLVDRVGEIDERIQEIEEEQEEIKQEVREVKEDDPDAEIPKDLRNDWQDLEAEVTELRGDRKKFIEAIVVWDDGNDITNSSLSEVTDEEVYEAFSDIDECVFTVEELTFGQLQGVSDDMMEQSFEVDVEKQDIDGTPKQGYYKVELLREAIISWPKNAPSSEGSFGKEIPATGEYPIPVGEWLFDKVDALNTRGDTEMGNSSLEEAMKFKN